MAKELTTKIQTSTSDPQKALKLYDSVIEKSQKELKELSLIAFDPQTDDQNVAALLQACLSKVSSMMSLQIDEAISEMDIDAEPSEVKMMQLNMKLDLEERVAKMTTAYTKQIDSLMRLRRQLACQMMGNQMMESTKMQVSQTKTLGDVQDFTDQELLEMDMDFEVVE